MLNFENPLWNSLKGGYRLPYDPRPALRSLEAGGEDAKTWDELWQELHHQGDVDEASYASVPHLVRIHCEVRRLGWNLYALASCIELERHRKSNPPLPMWLIKSYDEAIQRLLIEALGALRGSDDVLECRSALSFVALARGHLKIGAMLSTMDDSETDEWADNHLSWTALYT